MVMVRSDHAGSRLARDTPAYVFDEVIYRIVDVGERSGAIVEVVHELARNEDRRRSQIAWRYVAGADRIYVLKTVVWQKPERIGELLSTAFVCARSWSRQAESSASAAVGAAGSEESCRKRRLRFRGSAPRQSLRAAPTALAWAKRGRA